MNCDCEDRGEGEDDGLGNYLAVVRWVAVLAMAFANTVPMFLAAGAVAIGVAGIAVWREKA